MTPSALFRVADLSQRRPTPFALRPDADALRALADDLGLIDLRKLVFEGEIRATGDRDWELAGHLGATVVQPCVVTLEPVTTRIETDVARTYLADYRAPEAPETEMPEDDTTEPLGPVIDAGTVMAEALALALPLYPRKEGAELGDAVFAAPGVAPMRDEDTKPFAGLAGLRDALKPKN